MDEPVAPPLSLPPPNASIVKQVRDHVRDLAPNIKRQRLLMEGYYSIALNREAVASYLTQVAAHLGLRSMLSR